MEAQGPQTEAELLPWRPPSHRAGAFPAELLSPGERVLFETKPSLLGLYWGRLVVLILLDLLWIGLAVGLPTNPTGGLFAGVTTLVIVYYVLKWRSSAYALTNRRVLAVVGIRQPDVAAALLDQVQNLKLEGGSSGGIKFDATPPDAPTNFLGGRRFAKTIYWRALPLASRTYEFVQQAFAVRAVQTARDGLRADLVERISHRTIPCEYCGTLIDPETLDPAKARCPSCGAPFVPIEILRAAAQARLSQTAAASNPTRAAAPVPSAAPGATPVSTAAPRPPAWGVTAPRPGTAAAADPATRIANPPASGTRSASAPAALPTPTDREPPHRRRDRRATGSIPGASGLLALGILAGVFAAGLGLVPAFHVAPAARAVPSITTDGVSPAPTFGAGATFDAADGYVLMFGGLNPDGNVVGWTWSFVHNNWTNLSAAVGAAPSPRWGEGLAYDARDGYVVLFGGCRNLACSEVLNDTWIYAHDRWTNVTAGQADHPAARGRTMMVYDAYDRYILLFGGNAGGGVLLNDEWAFSAGNWTAVGNLSSARPAPRAGAMLAYDPATSSAILFGGFDASASLGDTWSYQNGTWTNLTSGLGVAPGPRRLGGMTYDAADGYLLLVNGYNNGYLGDEWTFASGAWTEISPRGAPLATFSEVLVYDPVDGYVLYFSGDAAQGVVSSTLAYSNGAWTLLISPTQPGLSILVFAFLVLAVAAPVTVAVVVGSRVRRRQEQLLGEGFLLPPGERPTWVPTGPAVLRRNRWQSVLLVAVIAVIVLPLLAASGGPAGAAFLLVAFAINGVLIAVVLWASYCQITRAIGIARSGVILTRKAGEVRIPWAILQPGVMPPRRGVYWFQYLVPGKAALSRGFLATIDQARAILSSPFAPPWVLTAAVGAGLGLSPRFAAPGPSPGGPVPSPGTTLPSLGHVTSPAPGPLPGQFGSETGAPAAAPGGAPAAGTPERYRSVDPDPGSRGPLLATRTPATGAPKPIPSAPSRPPPGMVPCPKCGQLNAAGRVAFCTACGTRLS